MSKYRQILFNSYHVRTNHLDKSSAEKLDWFRWYVKENYLAHLPAPEESTNTNILEIGCNRGYLLRALDELGYKNLHGIDLSPIDLRFAQELCPSAHLSCIDAFEYLESNQLKFSFIVIKAVLEHQPKDMVIPLIQKMSQALLPGGKLIIDVPNMDWIFASHERYMDFTHEVGFTQESLAQVMSHFFDTYTISPVNTSDTQGVLRKIIKKTSRFILSLLFRAAQLEWPGHGTWQRALVGVGVKNKE